MSKLLYLDTETTGLDAEENALTQVAAIVVIDGQEVDRIALDINPYTYMHNVVVDDAALKITKKTKFLIKKYPDQRDQCHNFVAFLCKHVNPEDRKDVFQPNGYNTSFDLGFIKAWFKGNGVYMNTYFSYKEIDVFALVKHMRLWGMLEGCKNDKLGTVCEHYGIRLDAHDAMNDIVATRKLYKTLIGHMEAHPAYVSDMAKVV